MHAFFGSIAALAAALAAASPPDVDVTQAEVSSLAPLDLAAMALAQNPAVAAQQHAIRAADANATGEGAFPEPMLEARVAPLSLPGPFLANEVPLGVEVALSQPIPLADRLGSARAAARAEAAVVAAGTPLLTLDLVERAATLGCDAWAAARAADVNEHHREILDAMRSAARDALAAGRGSVDEALRADAEAAALDDEGLASTTRLSVLSARINGLLHRAPDAPLPAAPDVLSPIDVGEPLQPSSSATTHPGLTEGERRVRAAEARAVAVDAENVPDLRLTASYSSMWPDTAHQLLVGVGIDLPTTQRARDARLARAHAERAAAARLLDERRDQVWSEERAAGQLLDEARARVKLFEERRLPLAMQRTQATRASFGAGAGSLLEVLAALRDERHMVLEAQEARADVCRREVALRRARGLGLAGTTSAPAASVPSSSMPHASPPRSP